MTPAAVGLVYAVLFSGLFWLALTVLLVAVV